MNENLSETAARWSDERVEDWRAEGAGLVGKFESARFDLLRWMAEGVDGLGNSEARRIAAEVMGVEAKTASNWWSVAAAYEPAELDEREQQGLTFSHLRAVAPLESPQRRALLDRASNEGLSTRQLTLELSPRGESSTTEPDSPRGDGSVTERPGRELCDRLLALLGSVEHADEISDDGLLQALCDRHGLRPARNPEDEPEAASEPAMPAGLDLDEPTLEMASTVERNPISPDQIVAAIKQADQRNPKALDSYAPSVWERLDPFDAGVIAEAISQQLDVVVANIGVDRSMQAQHRLAAHRNTLMRMRTDLEAAAAKRVTV